MSTSSCKNRRHTRMARYSLVCGALLLLLSLPWAIPAVAQMAHAGAAPASNPLAPVQILSRGQAVIMGIVEGLTEYLPVSSTGHLILTQHLLGISDAKQTKEAIDAYEVIIQAGAILAVLLLYFGRIRRMINGILGRDPEGRQLAINIFIAFLPAAVIGLLLEKYIQKYLFDSFGMWPTVFAWFVGGIVILVVSRKRKSLLELGTGKGLEQLKYHEALKIGWYQCFSMWPGVSRSLSTILGGMASGLNTMAAVEFSFILGLLTLGAATVLEVVKHGHAIIHDLGWVNPCIGMLAACVAAIFAVKWMVGYLNKHGLAAFGYYRIALSVVVFGALLLKVLV